MTNALRIPLRLIALAAVFAGLAALVVPIMGPEETARALGESCSHTRHPNPEQCTIVDSISLFWTFGGLAVIGGLIAVAVLRRPGGGTFTLDFSRS